MRKELFAGSPARARAKYGFTRGKPMLLVLGGGSGSRTLNEAVQAHLPALLETFQIVHLRGNDGGNPAPDAPHGYKAIAYELDMASAYAAADLVLSRAGSNTVFEALALKKPALFVPLERASAATSSKTPAISRRSASAASCGREISPRFPRRFRHCSGTKRSPPA